MNYVGYWGAVIIAFGLILGLSWCAKAQEAQVGPKWDPVRIEVVMHRVHHVHRHRHHHVHRANAGAGINARRDSRESTGGTTTAALPSVTSPLFIEFVTWCVARALPCMLPPP